MYSYDTNWIYNIVLFKGKGMKAYIDLLKYILENGDRKEDRTNTGTISSFGHQLSFDLSKGFPAVTTKSLAWKGVVSELLWFLEGSSDERRLAEIRFNKDNQGKNLGYENTEIKKELGPVYGVQWREWDGKDQIQDLLKSLKNNPDSRRHILSAWNVGKIDTMALPPCHVMSQFYVNKGTISCHMYQRSADMFLGVPFNIASYALLLSIFGEILGLQPKKFVHSFGDAHIYLNSLDQVREQISREPLDLPTLVLPKLDSLEALSSCSIDDFKLHNYKHHPAIKAKMAI
jgi:thymidylate synthase